LYPATLQHVSFHPASCKPAPHLQFSAINCPGNPTFAALKN
jgi:hypothetical protein